MLEDDLLCSITNAIYAIFGPSVPIYTERVAQGLKEPCFFVLCINESERPLLGIRAMRKLDFDVVYLAKGNKTALREAASKLYPALRRVTMLDGTQVNGFDLKWQITDDALHFFVSFKPTIRYTSDIDLPMQEVLKQETNVKA